MSQAANIKTDPSPRVNSQKTPKKVNYAKLFGLAIASLTIVGLPFLIWYLKTHTFRDVTKEPKTQPSANKTNELARGALSASKSEAIAPASEKTVREKRIKGLVSKINDLQENQLTENQRKSIRGYIQITLDWKLYSSARIQSQRLRKKWDGVPFSLTPIADKDNKINGYLLHGEEIGRGAFSKVKIGYLLMENEDQWDVKKVSMHRGLKEGKYKEMINYCLDTEKMGYYKKDINLLTDYFGEETHSNVESVPICYGWLDDTHEFMVHELHQGDANHIPATSSQHLLEMARDIAEGLKFCHDRQVLVCDLKPANVLIDQSGRAMISDMMPKKEDDKLKYPVGTPIFRPSTEITNSKFTDMYALGATFRDLTVTYLRANLSKSTEFLKSLEEKNNKEDYENKLSTTIDICDRIENSNNDNENDNEIHKKIYEAQKQCIEFARDYQNDLIDHFFNDNNEDKELVKTRLAYLDRIADLLLNGKAGKCFTVDQILGWLTDTAIKNPDLTQLPQSCASSSKALPELKKSAKLKKPEETKQANANESAKMPKANRVQRKLAQVREQTQKFLREQANASKKTSPQSRAFSSKALPELKKPAKLKKPEETKQANANEQEKKMPRANRAQRKLAQIRKQTQKFLQEQARINHRKS